MTTLESTSLNCEMICKFLFIYCLMLQYFLYDSESQESKINWCASYRKKENRIISFSASFFSSHSISMMKTMQPRAFQSVN